MSEKGKDKGNSPWVDVRAIRWSKSGQLLVQAAEGEGFVPIQKYYASHPELANITPINLSSCGIGPHPKPPTPDGFCTTLAVRRIRSRVDGIDVETEMGTKSLDELIRLVDRNPRP